MKKITILFLVFCCIVNSETNQENVCNEDSDCKTKFNDKYFCANTTCVHESILPTSLDDVIGLLLIITISMIANLGGIGGGEIIVSVYIYFFQYSIREAVPLSKITIFASSLINFLVNYNRRSEHNPNQFLIDYRLISLILPAMLAGTTIGVIFTKSFPTVIILILITCLVVNYSIKMTIKARQMYSLENAMIRNTSDSTKNQLVLFVTSFTDKLKTRISTIMERPKQEKFNYEVLPAKDFFDEVRDEELKYLERKKNKSFSELMLKDSMSIFIILSSLFVILVSTFLRTFHHLENSACSSSSLFFFFFAQISCYMFAQLSYKNNLQMLNNLTIGSIEGNKRFFRHIIMNSYLAGILAGTLGMGGGIIINPMLIGIGIGPEVSTAASNVVVLFTSLSTSSQFLMLGNISVLNIILVLILSGMGAFIAATILDDIIRSYNRPSLLVWILAILLISSAIIIPIVGNIRASEEVNPFSFRSPC